jgi:hypothetical protein
MEEHHQQLQFIFRKFAGSVIERTDSDLNIICYTETQIENITKKLQYYARGRGVFSVVYKSKT